MSIKKIFFLFFSWRVLLCIFAALAAFILPLKTSYITDFEFRRHWPYIVWIWANFDGFHYIYIAKYGYGGFEHPFFPLYPILIYLLHLIFGIQRIIGGQIISNTSFFLSLIVMGKLLIKDKKDKLIKIIIFVILLFPTSLFYAAVYNDSLFLLLALLTIYMARKKSWFLSGIFGALATLTRLNGLALIFIIFFEYIQSNETSATWRYKQTVKNIKILFKPSNIVKDKIYSILLIPSAFLGYLVYTRVSFGNWSKVFSSMEAWDQNHLVFPPQVFWRYLKILVINSPSTYSYMTALSELMFVVLYILLIVFSYKKIRFSYWIFFIISIIIPSLTGTFQGMPRYGLHLYPFFLSLAIFLKGKSKYFKIAYFIISTSLLFWFLTLFSRGYFVA